MKNLGAPDEVIQELEDADKTDFFEVFPENWPTVQMFVRLQTQWRTSAMGLLGLDYGVAFRMFDVYGVEDQKAMLDGLSVMEREALVAFSEEREK